MSDPNSWNVMKIVVVSVVVCEFGFIKSWPSTFGRKMRSTGSLFCSNLMFALSLKCPSLWFMIPAVGLWKSWSSDTSFSESVWVSVLAALRYASFSSHCCCSVGVSSRRRKRSSSSATPVDCMLTSIAFEKTSFRNVHLKFFNWVNFCSW